MAPSQQKPPAAGGGNGEGKKLDVYRDWLKISATNRPLNYYQILKLKMFEDDPAVIRKHYRELNAYIRKFATGDYIEESQKLLNTLAKAMLCLTDHERKEEYDFSLGRKGKEIEGPRTLETILLQNKVVTPEQIKKAKGFSASGASAAARRQARRDHARLRRVDRFAVHRPERCPGR